MKQKMKIAAVIFGFLVFWGPIPSAFSEEKETDPPPLNEFIERSAVKPAGYPPCTLSRTGGMQKESGRYQLAPAGFGNLPILLDSATGLTWVLYSSPPTWKPVLYDRGLLPGKDGFCTD